MNSNLYTEEQNFLCFFLLLNILYLNDNLETLCEHMIKHVLF